MSRFLKNTTGAILIFIAIVCLLECIYRLLKIPKITHHNIYAKAQDLVPQINNNSILIIGDSKLEWGIKPLQVQNKLSNDSINVIDMAMPGSNGLDVLKYLLQNEIYPKLIISGYAVNYGNYNNHGFDKIAYTTKNKITERAGYFMDEHFYFRDQSVLEYIKHGSPYFKSHQYDRLGGATVTEYGDYTKRANTQLEMYKGFKNNFTQSTFDKYCMETNALLKYFKEKGTLLCGLNMPVSKKIYELQNVPANSTINCINYDKFYDFSTFTYTNEAAKPDSSFFYDGCHLLPEYAVVFSEKLIHQIKNDFPGIH
ncbi:MAG: hypothetical protein IPP72_12160 [Chitinophagaceae bacterium]|nr:hypothetical protein [Chitinophagaceae bacterium]